MLKDETPPPPPSSGGREGDNNVSGGGGAPIAGGLGILMALGAAYGIKKTYQFYYHKNNE
ncbi:MAG: hypothetical protein U5L09_05710 [Bacteroidales bacterium]|nr:hypothetical protein [Bacteroidales bacterium]